MQIFAKSLLVAAGVLGLGSLSAQAQTGTYNGNGASGGGFGGGVSNGVLTVTSNATTINFSLSAGGNGFDGNALIIYIDSVAGGVNNTSTFTDSADGGRIAISGYNPTANNGNPARTLANFASGFNADFAIALEPNSSQSGGNANTFNLSTPTNFGYVGTANLTYGSSTIYNLSIPRSDLGLSATAGFTFEATLISPSGYRSNETIGTSVTTVDPANPGTAPNAGFTGTTTFSAFNTYGTPVPEPSTLALSGLAVLAGVGALRRRQG